MKSHLQLAGKITAKQVALYGTMAALLLAVQVGLMFLPNIELVSVLLIVYTMVIGKKVFYPLYVFVLLEGLIYGFGIWWVNYLYVWAVLVLAVLLLKKQGNALFWAIVAAIFGLMFGALTSIPYFIAGGLGTGCAYFLNGIPFDLLHMAGNFVTTFVLYKPLMHLMKRCTAQFLGFAEKQM